MTVPAAAPTDRTALRELLLARRRAVPEWTRNAYDRAIAQRLSYLLPETGDVFFYVGTGFEIATLDAIRGRLDAGGGVCVPLCRGKGRMTARRIRSADELVSGRFGIPEPPEDAELVEDPAAAVVPGLAFSPDGHRIGRGGGYYDRWLDAHPDCLTAGLCYEAFLTPIAPAPHDRRVRFILTERRCIVCS